MHLNHTLKSKTQIIVTLVLALGIVSCGSYEYAGYENDSIYNDTKKTTVIKSESPSSTNNQYYQNYFKEKTEEYALYAEDEDAIFTDIESYEGDYNEENDTADGESYAGWGGNNSDITINGMVVIPLIVFGGIILITLLGVGITAMAMVMFGDTDSIITTVGIDRYGSTMAGAGAGDGTVLIGTQVITTVHTTETVTTTAIMKVPIKDDLYHIIEQDVAQQLLHVQEKQQHL